MIKKHNLQTSRGNKFTQLLKKYKYNINKGDIVAGIIIYKETSGFLINMGTKIAGYLPNEELAIRSNNKATQELILVCITREFFVLSKNINTNQPIISIKRLEYIRAWKRIKQLYPEDVLISVEITYVNKGGIITYVEGIQSFIPKSHIEITMTYLLNQSMLNQFIQCKLLVMNEQKNQLILSNKKAMLTSSKHKFKLGELLYGKIILMKRYGLFLDIHGIRALLHVSEIGFTYINNMNIFFNIGKLIKVKVIHINIKQGRLSVSKKNIKL